MLMSRGVLVPVPDRAGGQFTLAGDIDRLLPLDTELLLERGFDLSVLGRVEAFEDVNFAVSEMPAIVQEVVALRSLAKPGPDIHGLERLRLMAEHGARMPGSVTGPHS